VTPGRGGRRVVATPRKGAVLRLLGDQMVAITAPSFVIPTSRSPFGEIASSPVPVVPVGSAVDVPVSNLLTLRVTIPRLTPLQPGTALRNTGNVMTLTQLNAFVLVARLGSVTAAANALGVSESAVSQALSALRLHLGDQLVSRGPTGMTLTAGGSRLLSTASQIVVLGAEAHAQVRAAQGAPEQLRVVATSTLAEFVVSPLMEAFTRRFPGVVEVSAGVAVTSEMAVLVANRLADVAIGQAVSPDPALPVVSEPIFRYRLVVVTAGESRLKGNARQWRWLVDPAGTDPDSDTGRLLAALRIPDSRIGVFPNQTAAWAAAADGAGVAPAVEHLVTQQLRRGELSLAEVPGTPVAGTWHATLLERQSRSAVASALRRFLTTPEAMHLMRSPATGIPPSRFRPPVYVTIWS
jgi:LysR family transcriptional regulator, low CO2-responsive transcriptional regulator